MIRFLAAALVVAAPLAATSTRAQTAYTPPPGSPERKALLDLVRPAVERDLRGPVEFKVSKLRIAGSRALLVADPQRPSGRPIDVADTKFSGQSDMMDGLRVDAVYVRSGSRWSLKDYAVGATDVWYVDECGRTAGLCD